MATKYKRKPKKKTVRLPKPIPKGDKWAESKKRKYHNRPGSPNLYDTLTRTSVYMDANDLLFLKAYAQMMDTTVSRVIVGLVRTFKKQAASKARPKQVSVGVPAASQPTPAPP